MSRPSSTVSYARNEHLNPALYATSPVPEPAIASHTISHQEAMERFTVSMPCISHCRKPDHCVQTILRDLEGLIIQLPIQSLAALPPNHDLRHLVRQVLFVAASSIDHNRTPLHMSQKIVQLLYKSSSQLGREIYVALLDQLCRTFEDVAKEAITWLLYAEDEVSPELPLFIHTAHVASAQTQHSCHCDSVTKRSCQHFASGSTASEKFVHRSSPQFAKLRSRSHTRMSIK